MRDIENQTVWLDQPDFAALVDAERHLAHIVLTAGKWLVFDGTRLNASRRGFAPIGLRDDIQDAKRLAENTVAGRLIHPPYRLLRQETSGEAATADRAEAWGIEARRRLLMLLRSSSIALEWAAYSEDWRAARRRARELVADVEKRSAAIGDPGQGEDLKKTAEILGKAVLRRQRAEIARSLAGFRGALDRAARPHSPETQSLVKLD
ncbi:MAG: hypothetical protein KGN84_06545 [Acidobacteriota bacterium]|nr:hypothetical protein [Acidobacteriota bacterium]